MPDSPIRIAHSPDSDDAFMFYALTQGLLDDEGLAIEHVLEDIESLNRRALVGELEQRARVDRRHHPQALLLVLDAERLDVDPGRAAEQPEGVPKENWLPINRGDYDVNIIMRLYAPDLEKFATWSSPVARKLD